MRGAGAGGGVRRGGGDGVRGLPHQPVSGGAHEPADGRVGRQLREPHAPAPRDRPADTRAGRERLHRHLPPEHAGPRGEGLQLGGGRRARQGPRGRRRDHHQHGHRLARGAHPDHRDVRAARGLLLGHQEAQGSRVDSARDDEPDQLARRGGASPGRGSRGHGLHGATLPRRPPPGAQGGGGPGRRDQHVHRLQPGLPRPHLLRYPGLLPRQPLRLPRDGAGLQARRAADPDRCRRGRPGGAGGGDDGGGPRPRGDALRLCNGSRGAVQHGEDGAGQGGVLRDHPLLQAPAGADGRDGAARRAGGGGRADGGGIRRRGGRDRRHAPQAHDTRQR
mmetsp:Transcript_2428/g.5094  ORF Transcript_2428/g.5094 Transcript_2428/m.5094 type:complete len:334 (-) Transcript_2428:556-1557(-)